MVNLTEQDTESTGSDTLYPTSIFDNTREYLNTYLREANECYENGLYNSCLLILEIITETLISDLYKSRNLQEKITTARGGYFRFSELVSYVTNEPSWKLPSNLEVSLLTLKSYTDSRTQNSELRAGKTDVDSIKEDVNIIFSEFVKLIDYPNFKSYA
jgi:hypothetical protein